MKSDSSSPRAAFVPTHDQIAAKALQLYIHSGWLPGRDLDNWLEAERYLIAHPAAATEEASSTGEVRSHSHRVRRHGPE